MSKKQYFIIIDTETTIESTVCDFGAIVVDRQGRIVKQLACLIKGEFGEKELFHDKKAIKSSLWAMDNLKARNDKYLAMLNEGNRLLASVSAANRWLEKVKALYNPTLTAYNLAFDTEKCANTLIDLTIFEMRFCLWQAALGNICNTKKYKEFVLNNHVLTSRTGLGNMSIRTNAETVTGFLQGTLTDEPHTALEDAIYYELPILQAIVSKRNYKEKIKPFNWREWQVKDHYSPK
jgi:hypothetical protein